MRMCSRLRAGVHRPVPIRVKGRDLFWITVFHTTDYPDIHPVVSAHVETVVLMSKLIILKIERAKFRIDEK